MSQFRLFFLFFIFQVFQFHFKPEYCTSMKLNVKWCNDWMVETRDWYVLTGAQCPTDFTTKTNHFIVVVIVFYKFKLFTKLAKWQTPEAYDLNQWWPIYVHIYDFNQNQVLVAGGWENVNKQLSSASVLW